MSNTDPQPCVAIDAMGGDVGPAALVAGAVQVARETSLSLLLVGKEDLIKAELEQQQIQGLDIQIVHAESVAEMGDKPSHILRRKKDTSIQATCNLVKEGRAQGMLSAGHTGVTLASAMFTLGRIKGIERPALAALLPRESKPLVLIDVGANVDSKPRHLVQFAVMAEALAHNVLQVPHPKVSLLNIGEEKGKGNQQVNETYQLLGRTSLNFTGNVEGRDLFSGDMDIVVCDGFVGNIALKLSEGLGQAFSQMLRQELNDGFMTRMGAMLAKPAFKRFVHRLDHEEYGGAPLLGLNGTVFVCHGTASPKAVSKALHMAVDSIRNKANDDIRMGLEMNPEITRFQRLKSMLHTSASKNQAHEEDKE
ncbi:MAG: phosphate acyltransferase PlsX [Desulfohalobiaceae bacterium]